MSSVPVEDSDEDPKAFLFPNGNALFFGKDGSQISKFQSKGWKGVHLFKGEYPDAEVFVAIWNSGEIRRTIKLHDESVNQIRQP